LLTHAVFDDDLECVVVDGIRRRATPAHWRLLLILRNRFRRWLTLDFLARASARDPLDGGSPDVVRVQLCRVRKLLEDTPFAIANAHGGGYGLFRRDEVRDHAATPDRKCYRLRPQTMADGADVGMLDL
jgi:DNA-binding response OmpR family regulator